MEDRGCVWNFCLMPLMMQKLHLNIYNYITFFLKSKQLKNVGNKNKNSFILYSAIKFTFSKCFTADIISSKTTQFVKKTFCKTTQQKQVIKSCKINPKIKHFKKSFKSRYWICLHDVSRERVHWPHCYVLKRDLICKGCCAGSNRG